MRWYKHMSNMRNHQVIKAARYKWGNEAYAFWCLLLELCAEACGNNPDQELEFDAQFLKREVMLSESKIKKILHHLHQNSLIFWSNPVDKKNNPYRIKVLKLASIRDNHTKNLQVTGKSLAHKNKEERIQKEEVTPVIPKGEKPKNGTRLSEDWSPSSELEAWAKKERPDLNIPLVVESFKDYWRGIPGTKGVKLCWDSTFRNWVRNTKYDKPTKQTSKGSQISASDIKLSHERTGGHGLL